MHNNTEDNMNDNIKLCFCPTMTPYAEKIAKEVNRIELVPYPSAAMVMSALLNKVIDIALIGREAYSEEINTNISKKRLKNGYTLVYREKVVIPEEKLNEIPIKTYLSKEIAEQILPNPDNIIYCESLKECDNPENDLPILIDWRDFSDKFELLIPINSKSGKTPIFRAPIVYYNNNVSKETIDSITIIIKD